VKIFIFLLMIVSSVIAQDHSFQTEASQLAQNLKQTLMKNLKEKISKEGAVAAIPFCHENVKPIAKSAAENMMSKYEFGRTSHKIRNTQNAPQEWMIKYLEKFQESNSSKKANPIIHKFENGKTAYLEPLYVSSECLVCHGDKISSSISSKIKEIYPKDLATGFKLGEFRGMIWIKEK
jgi:hypothetical protein